MVEEKSDAQVIDGVMTKIEKFYFDTEGDSNSEMVFNEFAAKHEHLFDEECDAMDQENKLE